MDSHIYVARIKKNSGISVLESEATLIQDPEMKANMFNTAAQPRCTITVGYRLTRKMPTSFQCSRRVAKCK